MAAKQHRQYILQVILLIVVLFGGIQAKSLKRSFNKLPSFVKVCHRNDPELNKCAIDSLMSLKERLIYGIPELYIPPIEPLIIPEVRMDQDTGAIYMHSTYKNVTIKGLSNFTLNYIKIEPAKLKFHMSMSFPTLQMNSKYNIKGKIMMMPLMGDGNCNMNFTDVTLDMELYGVQYKKAGQNFIRIKNIQMKYKLNNVQIHLDNLFNGDKALGERMNTFLNENWQSLSEEIRPLMQKALIDVLRASTDKLFDAYTYDDLLPL